MLTLLVCFIAGLTLTISGGTRIDSTGIVVMILFYYCPYVFKILLVTLTMHIIT